MLSIAIATHSAEVLACLECSVVQVGAGSALSGLPTQTAIAEIASPDDWLELWHPLCYWVVFLRLNGIPELAPDSLLVVVRE